MTAKTAQKPSTHKIAGLDHFTNRHRSHSNGFRYDPERGIESILLCMSSDPRALILHVMEPHRTYRAFEIAKALNSYLSSTGIAEDMHGIDAAAIRGHLRANSGSIGGEGWRDGELVTTSALQKFIVHDEKGDHPAYALTQAGVTIFKPIADLSIAFVASLQNREGSNKYESLHKIIGARGRSYAVYCIVRYLAKHGECTMAQLTKHYEGKVSYCTLRTAVSDMAREGVLNFSSAFGPRNPRRLLNASYQLNGIAAMQKSDDEIKRIAFQNRARSGPKNTPNIKGKYLNEIIDIVLKDPNVVLTRDMLIDHLIVKYGVTEATAYTNVVGSLALLVRIEFLKCTSPFSYRKVSKITPNEFTRYLNDNFFVHVEDIAYRLDNALCPLISITGDQARSFAITNAREKKGSGNRPNQKTRDALLKTLEGAGPKGWHFDTIARKASPLAGKKLGGTAIRRRYLREFVEEGIAVRHQKGFYSLANLRGLRRTGKAGVVA